MQGYISTIKGGNIVHFSREVLRHPLGMKVVDEYLNGEPNTRFETGYEVIYVSDVKKFGVCRPFLLEEWVVDVKDDIVSAISRWKRNFQPISEQLFDTKEEARQHALRLTRIDRKLKKGNKRR